MTFRSSPSFLDRNGNRGVFSRSNKLIDRLHCSTVDVLKTHYAWMPVACPGVLACGAPLIPDSEVKEGIVWR